jgi:hypothetical protein
MQPSALNQRQHMNFLDPDATWNYLSKSRKGKKKTRRIEEEKREQWNCAGSELGIEIINPECQQGVAWGRQPRARKWIALRPDTHSLFGYAGQIVGWTVGQQVGQRTSVQKLPSIQYRHLHRRGPSGGPLD